MSRYEVKVHSRHEPEDVVHEFVVDASSDQDALRWGSTADRIADQVAAEFCDSGNVVVRRIGGGERVVRARS